MAKTNRRKAHRWSITCLVLEVQLDLTCEEASTRSLIERLCVTNLNVGAYGLGVSALVRSAYAFLAHNYEEGDEIFFFGFSRGAYIARSIAGLVTSLGLLTKEGMDHFPLVYEKYYDHEAHRGDGTEPDKPFEDTHTDLIDALTQRDFLAVDARKAVKVVGVWDTVGFHREGEGGEKFEFRNTELSPLIPHAYHCLALDERRKPFAPTLWKKPSDETIEKALGHKPEKPHEMQQVWFSGRHSDIGGGLDDPRLSDIALGWMIARLRKTESSPSSISMRSMAII